MALASANFHTGRFYGGMCPQFSLAFSLEEAPTFGRGSSLFRQQSLSRLLQVGMGSDQVLPEVLRYLGSCLVSHSFCHFIVSIVWMLSSMLMSFQHTWTSGPGQSHWLYGFATAPLRLRIESLKEIAVVQKRCD